MELRHLRYFVAVAEAEHVGRAAERLRVAQPALSRQIQDLERDVGVALFTREKKRLRLTDAGRDLLRHAVGLLAQAECAVRSAQRVARGLSGELVVGFVEAVPRPTVRPLGTVVFGRVSVEWSERIAQPLARREVSVRRNAGRFRAAGGGVAQTHECSASQISAKRT